MSRFHLLYWIINGLARTMPHLAFTDEFWKGSPHWARQAFREAAAKWKERPATE